MRHFLLAISSLLLLAACEPTVDSYVKDAKKREGKLRECAEMGIAAAKDDKYCEMAMEAQGIVIREAANDLINSITLQSGEETEKN